MPSGRRYSVLIFCVSPVKELYLSALDHYDPDSVFVFIPTGDDTVSDSSREIYRSVSGSVRCTDVTEIEIDTTDFKQVLGRMIDIKSFLKEKYGDYLDLFVNISSGCNEFAAAATFACMLPKRCTPFRVDLDTGSFDKSKIMELVESCGFAASVPETIAIVQNNDPHEELVGFLKVIYELNLETMYPKAKTIIEELKKRELWTYNPEKKANSGRTPLENKEKVYLNRNYIGPAIENGWLFRNSHQQLLLTDSGMSMIDVYGRIKGSVAYEYSSCEPMCLKDVCYEADDYEPKLDKLYSKSIRNDMLDEDSVIEEDSGNLMILDSGEKTYRFRISLE